MKTETENQEKIMNKQINRIATLACLTIGMLAAFSSCGKDNKNNTAAATQCPVGQTWNGMQCTYSGYANNLTTTGMAACPVGQVQTQEHGCLTQAGCDPAQSQAMLGNQCVRVTILNNGMMNSGMGMNMGMNPGMNMGMNPNMGMNINTNSGFGMNSEFGYPDSDLNSNMTGCNAYSQDTEVYYNCGTTASVVGKVRSSRARHMTKRECQGGCARRFVDTSYGCLPKKGCGKCLGNLDGVCVE